jgi:hypothetical protein
MASRRPGALAPHAKLASGFSVFSTLSRVSVMRSSYVPLVVERGAQVILEVQRATARADGHSH